jgi:hypothetical protein
MSVRHLDGLTPQGVSQWSCRAAGQCRTLATQPLRTRGPKRTLADLNQISLLQVAAFQALASLVVEPSPVGDLIPRFELVPTAPPTVPYSTDTYAPYQAAAGPVAVDEGDHNEPLTRAVPVVLAAPEHGAARSVLELTESLWSLDAASPAVPRLEALVSQLIADSVDLHVPAYTAHHTTPPPAAPGTSILDALVRPTPVRAPAANQPPWVSCRASVHRCAA